jgi:hypothetical protein
MRQLGIFSLVLFLFGCAGRTKEDFVPVPPTGLMADGCRAYREALIGHQFHTVVTDPVQNDGLNLEGVASFKKHESKPHELAVRVLRDRTGEIFDEHNFQFMADNDGHCAYSYHDLDHQADLILPITRQGDAILIGAPEEPGSFRLTPTVIDRPTRQTTGH